MAATAKDLGLFESIAAVEINGCEPASITSVVCDSRQVRAGSLFVAINGSDKDGAQFIDDALTRGAAAIVTESEVSGMPGYAVRVDDARLALAQLSASFRDNPSRSMFLAGVTGTNGKTTTAHIMRELLTGAGRETGLIGTVEYCIGSRVIPATRTTPEAPVLQDFLSQMLNAGCDSAVMEVSSHALVQKRTAAIDFDVGILTNLARDHMDYHETREAYANAKKMLFTDLSDSATAVLNSDDELGREILATGSLSCKTISYGSGSDADYRIIDVAPDLSGTAFKLAIRGEEHELRTNLIGRFNVYNIVAALAAVELAGIDLERAMNAVAQLTVIPGRLEEVPNKKGIKVLVDYAHTDDALEKILTALRETTEGRLLLVFGCGGDRDRTKRPAMGRVASELADFTVITSDNPRKENPETIISEIKAGFGEKTNFTVVQDREAAINEALVMAETGDVVVVAGKGHENFQEFENTTVSFDDRMVVKRILENL